MEGVLYGGDRGSRSDSYRLGVLFAQLYLDKGQKGLLGSIVSVMARDRQVCTRLPR